MIVEGFSPAESFGPEVAARYDDHPRGDETVAVEFLARYGGAGPALELAIGTGRIALPLAGRGIRVDGIDLSSSMVEKLRAKPGGDRLRVVIGDMAHVAVDGPYRIAYIVYNSIYNILDQDEQVEFFRNVARQLSDDGVFVVEAAPPWAWADARHREYARAEHVGAQSVRLDVVRYDPVTQRFDENHVRLDRDGIRFDPIGARLISPAEMDLMAKFAGLRLRERFGGWRGEPCTPDSVVHVSVYEHAH
ncbi:MAG TPA: class I SAM-dependent methyltransferase [Micromonosporaceae bacterium]